MADRIGILGGLGPYATQHFLRVLFDTLTCVLHPSCDQDFPDMTILVESTTPDRTDAIRSGSPDTAKRIGDDLDRLIASGCRPIAVACITAHALIDPAYFHKGVLDFRECLTGQYGRLGDAPIGVITTDGSLASEVFIPLERDFRLVYPTPAAQEQVMDAIYGSDGLKADSRGSRTVKDTIDSVVSDLEAQGARAFLAGCTEIEMFMTDRYSHLELLLPMVSVCEKLCDILADAKCG